MTQETRVESLVKSYQRFKNMILDASLLNTQHYKVGIKGKVGQSWERSSALPYTLVLKLSKRSLRITPDYGRQLVV